MDEQNLQQMQGFGVDPNQSKQMQLAAMLASLPDTDVAYDWMQGEGPQGQMVSGHYVAPSWTQYLADGAKTAIGAGLINKRNTAAKSMAEELRQMFAGGAMSPMQRESAILMGGQDV